MKVVLDTNALISSTIWLNSSARKTVQLLIAQKARFYTSKAILEEYEEAVRRDFPEKIGQLPQLISGVTSTSTLTESSSTLDVVKEDPDDNKIIECAVAAGAEFIVTYDSHLLKLKEYNGIRILTPEEMRRLLED